MLTVAAGIDAIVALLSSCLTVSSATTGDVTSSASGSVRVAIAAVGNSPIVPVAMARWRAPGRGARAGGDEMHRRQTGARPRGNDNGNGTCTGGAPRGRRAHRHGSKQAGHARVQSGAARRCAGSGDRRKSAHARRDFSRGRERPGVIDRRPGSRNYETVACGLPLMSICRDAHRTPGCTPATPSTSCCSSRVQSSYRWRWAYSVKHDSLERIIVERRDKVRREHDPRLEEADRAGAADVVRHAHGGPDASQRGPLRSGRSDRCAVREAGAPLAPVAERPAG